MAATTRDHSVALDELKRSIKNRELLLAAAEGDKPKVRKLLQEGADVNFAEADGNTALHWAAEKKRDDVIKLLLKQENVKHSAENRENETALDVSWKTENNVSLEMIGQKITEDTNRALSEYRVPPRTVGKNDTFRDATWNGDYDREFSQNDINDIMTFFCQPLPLDPSAEEFKMTLTLRVKNGHPIRLYYSEEGKTFFRVGTGANNAETPYGADINEDRQCSDYDGALQSARNVCYWLSDLTEKRRRLLNKRKKNTLEGKKHEPILKTELSKIVNQEGLEVQKYRQFFAACLDEIERTRTKVKKCNEFLETLREEKPETLTHKSAVTLIWCLETFAAEDAFSRIQLEKSEMEKLKHMKKNYCDMLFPDHQNQAIPKFQKLFQLWRDLLVHNGSNTHITIELLRRPWTVEAILEKLYEFSLIVEANCRSGGREDHTSEKLDLKEFSDFLHTSFIKFKEEVTSNDKSATPSAGNRRQFLLRFSNNVRKFLKEINNVDVMYELLYDLLVNVGTQIEGISPDLKTKQFDTLRNLVTHDFQMTGNHIWDELPSVVLHLYRRQLAVEINKDLMVLRDEKECTKIEEMFNRALSKVGKHFVDFPMPKQSFIQYKNTREEELTETYIKYLAPLIDRPLSGDDDDDLMSSEILPSIQQIRQLCEQFIILEQLNDGSKLATRKERLQIELQQTLKLDENQARHITANIKTSNSTANDEFRKEVLHIVKSLISLVIGDGKKKGLLSYTDLQSLITVCKTDASRFSFKELQALQKHNELLKHCFLKEEEKQSVENVLQYLPDSKEEREIENGDQNVVVNVFSVISHVLTLFVEVHEACQIKINSISSAFGDKIFLDHLVSLQMKWVPDKSFYELREPFKTYKIIRDIRKIKYTSPFVARILERSRNIKVIEYRNIKMLLMNLAVGGELGSLESLLRLEGDSRNLIMKAVSEVLIEDNFPEEKLEIFLKAMCNSEKLEDFVRTMIDVLQQMKSSDVLTGRIRRLLLEANDVALDLINEEKLDHATQLIESTKELQKKFLDNNLFTEDTHITSVRNLHEAKLLNARGLKAIRVESIIFYKKALDILQPKEQGEVNISPHSMLALSREAYSWHLLGKSTYNKTYALSAIQCAERLWSQMWQYISDNDDPPEGLKQFHIRAKESSRYQDLLNLGQEYFKYLNVSKLKSCVLFYRFRQFQLEENTNGLLTLLGEWDAFDIFHQQEGSFAKSVRFQVVCKKIGIHQVLMKLYHYNNNINRNYHEFKNLELQVLRLGMLRQHGRYTSIVRKAVEEAIKATKKDYGKWRR